MPNWCENDLYINGPDLDAVLQAIQGEESSAIDFQRIIPQPSDLDITSPPRPEEAKQAQENTRRYGAPTWYEWRIRNWGTKWNAAEARVDHRTKSSVVLRFDTAWSPARPVVEKLGEMFPRNSFKLCYFEQGCAFQGRFIVRRGEVIEDSSREYRGRRGG